MGEFSGDMCLLWSKELSKIRGGQPERGKGTYVTWAKCCGSVLSWTLKEWPCGREWQSWQPTTMARGLFTKLTIQGRTTLSQHLLKWCVHLSWYIATHPCLMFMLLEQSCTRRTLETQSHPYLRPSWVYKSPLLCGMHDNRTLEPQVWAAKASWI